MIKNSRLEDLINILRPFEVATRVMSTETFATLSMVRPLIRRFVDKFMKITEKDSETVIEIKGIISSELCRRFLESTDVGPSSLACFLVPGI